MPDDDPSRGLKGWATVSWLNSFTIHTYITSRQEIREMKEINATVLMLREEALWCAQCLEHDIAAQGETIDKAVEELFVSLVAQAIAQDQAGQTLHDLPKAPDRYWREFRKANTTVTTNIPPIKTIEDMPSAFMVPRLSEIIRSCT